MKKIILVVLTSLLVTASKAQFYVGGSFGIGLVKQYGNEKETTYKIIPEFGYSINKDWSVGLALGYKKGSCLVGKSYYGQNVESKAIGIQPYVRYAPLHISIVDIFIDGCFTYEKIIDEGVNLNIGLKPGFSITPINNLAIIAHIGFLGAEMYKPKSGDYKNGIAGIDMDASDLTLGVIVKF